MQSDFAAAGKAARTRIPVPPLDIEAIRTRSAACARERTRRVLAGALLALGVGGAAAALAGTAGGWHIWLFGNKIEVTIQSLGIIRYPEAADVRKVVARAAFPVVLPDGPRPGLRVLGIMYSPIDRPTLIIVQYGNASDPWAMTVSLIDTKKIAVDENLLPAGPAQTVLTHRRDRFFVGHEMVLVGGHRISAADAQRVENAMQHESPRQTTSAFDALLTHITVLQMVTPRVAELAGRIAPPGVDVLLADWDMRLIPRLARQGKPLRDSRVEYLSSIPQVHGQPDYHDARVYWPKAIALAPNGVRAVAAALRIRHVGASCTCAILVHASNGAYAVWKIDRRTLRVTQLLPARPPPSASGARSSSIER